MQAHTDVDWGTWMLGDLPDVLSRATELLGPSQMVKSVTLVLPTTLGDLPVVVIGAKDRHGVAQGLNDKGEYQQARDKVIGVGKDPTSVCFDNVDKALETARGHEQAEFKQAAGDGKDALTGLPYGAAVLAVLGAAGAVLGIGRRLSEYR